jgi:hypothetical protein
MGTGYNSNNRVVVSYDQNLSNVQYGQFIYNVAPSAADLVYLANLTSYALSENGCFKFTPTNGFILTWFNIEDSLGVQTVMITDGNYTFLILNYDIVHLSNLTAGYVHNGNEVKFLVTPYDVYFFQVNGPSINNSCTGIFKSFLFFYIKIFKLFVNVPLRR